MLSTESHSPVLSAWLYKPRETGLQCSWIFPALIQLLSKAGLVQPYMEKGARGGLHRKTFPYWCAVKILGHESPGFSVHSVLCPSIFLMSKLLKRGPRSFLGRQVGMENYSRSHFAQGKGSVVKGSSIMAGHPPGFPVQMSGKRLEQFPLHRIFSDKQRWHTIVIFPTEFFSITVFTAPLYKHNMHESNWGDQ